ncbi:MAG: response regulator [Crocinitomicaceae bacterium]|nr:response regulator [Crocinitomicaceae bacterium]
MKSILLIEDNFEVRENTAEILELAGYRVIKAENGKIGVELAQKENPDLVVCDIMMPVLDGYGVLHLLGKNSDTALIPFIFLTAKSERTDLRKGMEMGADDYLTKPFDDIELLNAVESRLKKSEMLKQRVLSHMDQFNSLFSNVSGIEDLTKISERQQVRSYRKKDIIFSEGDSPSGLYLMKRGKVKTFKSHELGKDLITKFLQPGDFFGYLSMLDDRNHLESAEALEDSEVIIFPKEDFFRIIYHSPAVTQQFVRMLSGNISEERERLLALAYSSVRKRTAQALVKLRERYHDGSANDFSMAISREDLANMVGTATESLIRTLSDFREEGIIRISGSTITLTDLTRLQRMKN